MKDGAVFCWLVFRPSATGNRWTTFRSRTAARVYARLTGGEIFKTVRAH